MIPPQRRPVLIALAAVAGLSATLHSPFVLAQQIEPGQQIATSATIKLPTDNDAEASKEVPYWLFLPANYEASPEPLPLLLFLHGSGERGDDLELVTRHGPPKLLLDAERQKSWPFITVSPQCPKEVRWDAAELAKLVEHVANTCRVDRRRIYVTGLSMGGSGAWSLLAERPGLFAGAIPICGKGDLAAAEQIAKTPVWIFVGDQDQPETVENCTQMTAALLTAGGKSKLTIYSGVGHDAWTETYNNQAVWDWLLNQRQPAAK
jgi:predicted peptidase